MIPEITLRAMKRDALRRTSIEKNEYASDFVLMEERSGVHYVFAHGNNTGDEACYSEFVKMCVARSIDPCRFVIDGGGLVTISSGVMTFYDESKEYGKFDIEAVKTIAKRYLKNHPEIDFARVV